METDVKQHLVQRAAQCGYRGCIVAHVGRVARADNSEMAAKGRQVRLASLRPRSH